ncbi:MAG: hypothetical protein R3B82_29590 [Sandaracinaceae bacterium]
MPLAPCPSCGRHVRLPSEECPFCTASLARAEPRKATPVRVLSRAAVVYFGAVLASGCGPGTPWEEETVLQPYGAPPDPEPVPDPDVPPDPEVVPPDPEVVPDPEPTPEPEADEPPEANEPPSTRPSSVAQPYGASPPPDDDGLEELRSTR